MNEIEIENFYMVILVTFVADKSRLFRCATSIWDHMDYINNLNTYVNIDLFAARIDP